MPKSSDRRRTASVSNSSSPNQRARRKKTEGNVYQLAPLLEHALLELLAQADATTGGMAATLVDAVQVEPVGATRLDLYVPGPQRFIRAADQQWSAALAEAQLPVTQQVLRPGQPGWSSALAPADQLVVLPLTSRNVQAGTLYLMLSNRELAQAGALERAAAGLAGVFLAAAERAQLQGLLRGMQELQQAILEIGAILDLPALHATVRDIARRILSCERVWFLTYDEAQRLHTPNDSPYPLPDSAAAAIDAAVASRDPCTFVDPKGNAVFACSHIIVGAQPMGLLLLQRDSAFSQQELELLGGLSQSLGQGLRNARIYQDSQETFAELRNALDELIQAERLRALGEIARGVAHDFNNLLTIISSHTQFLLETATDEQLYELEQIRQAIREGAETVGRLREFTRAATEEPQQHISLNKLILEVHQLTKPLIARLEAQRNTSITFNLDLGTLDDLPGNPNDLREMVVQMIHNSLDALPTGGTIWLRTWQDDQCAYLQVRDNGVGMSEEVRRRIFDPFFTTKAMRGTGLGLSMVYGVVRRYRGTIDVESVLGAGTTFTIRLPLVRGTLLAESE